MHEFAHTCPARPSYRIPVSSRAAPTHCGAARPLPRSEDDDHDSMNARRRRTLGIALTLVAALMVGCADGDGASTQTGSTAGSSETSRATELDPNGASRETQRAKGVILIVADTLRADRLGCYGYPRETSPHIDAMAARGHRWALNRSQGPWTVSSMQSMMTGLYSSRDGQVIPTAIPTIAELVSEAGVQTAAFVGNPVAGAKRGFARGFDHFSVNAMGTQRARLWVQEFVTWHRDQVDGDRPWFAWIQFMDTHHPYNPRQIDDKWGADERRPGLHRLNKLWANERETVRTINADFDGGMSALDAKRQMIEWSNKYDGEVSSIDSAMGDLESYLRELGVDDETLVIFAADHGEMFYEARNYAGDVERTIENFGGLNEGLASMFTWSHKAWFYPEQWSTPLIMTGPGFEAAEVHDGLSGNIDIAPTVLHALGVDVPEMFQGTSKLSNEAGPHNAVFAFGIGTASLLTDTGLQIIEHRPGRLGAQGAADERAPERPLELLDHFGPQPHKNLAAERPEDLATMAALLATWRERALLLPENRQDDTELQETLERMGYMEDEDGGD